jgi:hypothetical protein
MEDETSLENPPELPAELYTALSVLDPKLANSIVEALAPVAAEIGPREVAVIDRLAQGIATKANSATLSNFVRLLPVTVSRAVAPVIEPILA